MTRAERWGFHVATAVVAITGLAYALAKYLGERTGEFGPEPHPWLPSAQHAHVLAGPPLIFALGILFKAHVLPSLKQREHRRLSGILVLAFCTALALSGYLAQVQSQLPRRQALAWLHVPLGGLFLLGYASHLRRRSSPR